MKRLVQISILLFLAACREDTVPVSLSVAFSDNQPTTIESTLCKAMLIGPADLDTSAYLYRWDWEGDKVWDTRYLAIPYIRKSFPEAGDYRVTVEALSEDGTMLTATSLLKVLQGYSAPRPGFRVMPDSGNFRTLFTFDAGLTVDAEEEIKLLTFSWDFENDQIFDLVVKGDPLAQHQFPAEGKYNVTLMVADTSKLWAKIQKEVIVNLLDTLIIPVVRVEPEFPTDLDTVHFYADKSYYSGNPDVQLTYSWKKYGGGWTTPSIQSDFSWALPPVGTFYIPCRVYGADNLYNDKYTEVVVSRGNRKPTARISRNMRFGNILSVFEFSAWNSSDPENLPSELRVRWDFQGDGTWDTQFDYEKKASRVYSIPGIYQVTLEVIDKEGLKDQVAADVHVSGYNNPTSYMKDIRDQQVYGIVKVGDRWWMGENLKWEPGQETLDNRPTWICYQDNSKNCEMLGKLYYALGIQSFYTGETESRNICPRGWHLPSLQDWNDLIDEVGIESAGTSLAYGGSSDLNILPAGYAAYFVYGGFEEFQTDSIYKVAYMMTDAIGISGATTLQWKRSDSSIQFRGMPAKGYYSVRCVKDE